MLFALDNKLKVAYTTIEKFPLKDSIVSSLNYVDKIEGSGSYFTKIHKSEWERTLQITPNFTLKKIKADVLIPDFEFPKNIDLIYFDAFAPSKQAELWNESLFKRLYCCLANDGKLATYSAAGIVKQALRSAGFKVKRLKGPPGKHHMLFCNKA